MNTTIGRYVYGAAALALGVIGLAFGVFGGVWQPFPDDAPSRHAITYGVAGLFVLGGGLTLFRRTSAVGALLCAALYAMFAFFWLTMRLLPHAEEMVFYNGVAEQLAMAMGGLSILAMRSDADWSGRLAQGAQLVFGLCLLTFGTAHFVYTTETADMVPAWLPPDQRTWALVTGGAHAAAGLALLSGIFALPASRLLTAMFVGFGLLVWAPMLAADLSDHINWAGNAINLALVGAAWAIGDSIAQRRQGALSGS